MQGYGQDLGGQQGFEDPNKEAEGPWYVKYGIRALGTASGGLCVFLGALNLPFNILSPTCMLFTIWQVLVGIVVVTIEAPFCCSFVEHAQVVARKIEEKPLFIKAAVYVVAPLPTIFFCFGFSSFIGGGLVVAAGVMYGMIALGKKASREEMARNAQQTMAGAGAGSGLTGSTNVPYHPQPETVKNPFATINISRDPIAAAAAEWAQSAAKYEPPPSYNSSVGSNPPRTNWVSFEENAAARTHNAANPASSDLTNPFH